MHLLLDGLLVFALGLGLASTVYGLLRWTRISSPRRHTVTAAGSNDPDLREAVHGRFSPSMHGVAEGKAWNSTFDPFRDRRTPRVNDASTYHARSAAGVGKMPAWDPHAKEQSRVHRVRQARHHARIARLPDYYKLLELERGATDNQIEKAYRRRASTLHPDKFFDDDVRRTQAEAQLKELNRAMEVLRDPTRRARYDAAFTGPEI